MSDSFYQATVTYLPKLQRIDLERDYISQQKGALPQTVKRLTSEIEAFEERKKEAQERQVKQHEFIALQRDKIKRTEELIDKYSEELKNTKNDRQYEVINEDLEVQKLEIKLLKRGLAEAKQKIQHQNDLESEADAAILEHKKNLEAQQKLLSEVEAKTAAKAKELTDERPKIVEKLPDSILKQYEKIRTVEEDAVVDVVENACNGCFVRVPAQHQINIKIQEKIQTCGNCGRILLHVITPAVKEPKRRVRRVLRKAAPAATAAE